jgi:hypothetical protein
MSNPTDEKKAAKSRPTTPAPSPKNPTEDARIRDSMRRWQLMDEPARRLGRGLGMRALVERVALEVGTTQSHVQAVVKPAVAD